MIWYFKSNQKQNNRNRKEIKERERRKLPGAHLPGPARPSPSPLPPCRLPLPVGRGEAWRAPERPRPPPASPGHLLLPPRRPGDATRLPRPSLTLPCLSLRPYPPLLPLSRPDRTEPPPPTSSLAATATPSPLRRAPELRRSSLVLLVVSRDQKSPWMPLASPFPSSATEDRRRQIRRRSAFPEPAVHLYGIHVSSSVVSPSPLTRFLPLTPTTVGAESSSPPAMSPP